MTTYALTYTLELREQLFIFFNELSHPELNLALTQGWPETSAINMVFNLALSYYYLQHMINLIWQDSSEILPSVA